MVNYKNLDVATHTDLHALVTKHRPGAHDQRSHAGKAQQGMLGTQGPLATIADNVSGPIGTAANATRFVGNAAKKEGVKGAVGATRSVANVQFGEAVKKGKVTLEKGKQAAKNFVNSDDVKTAAWLGKAAVSTAVLPVKAYVGLAKLEGKTIVGAVKLGAKLSKFMLVDLNPAVMAGRALWGIAKLGYKNSKTAKADRSKTAKSLVAKGSGIVPTDSKDTAPTEQDNSTGTPQPGQDAASQLNGIISILIDTKKDFIPVLNVAIANDQALQSDTSGKVSDEDKKKSSDLVAQMKQKFFNAGLLTKEELDSLEPEAQEETQDQTETQPAPGQNTKQSVS